MAEGGQDTDDEPDDRAAKLLRRAEHLLACHAWNRAERLLYPVLATVPGHTDCLRLKRRLLAMREQLLEAAPIAVALTARFDARADDWFRRAQTEMRLRELDAAFDSALHALDLGLHEPRLIEPLVAGALFDPARAQLLLDRCRAIRRQPAAAVDDSGDARPILGIPWCNHWYDAHNGRHPLMTAPLKAPGQIRFLIYRPEPEARNPDARVLAHWSGFRTRFAALDQDALSCTRAEPAVFLGFRALRLATQPPPVDVEFLHTFPYTAGAIPFVFHIEQPETLFGPLHPWPCFKVTRDMASFRLTRALLADPRCLGIMTHIRATRRGLASFFDDSRITAKLRYVPFGALPPAPKHRLRRPARRGSACTFLFTNGFTPRPVNFFLRGGVDVLASFLRVNRQYPETRLVIAAPLPTHLDAMLLDRVLRHPRIRWYRERLDDGRFAALFRDADAYLLPSVMVHAVSVVQAMHSALPVVVADSFGCSEFVRHGKNGLIVPGRRLAVWRPDAGQYRMDYQPVLNALGAPADPLFTNRLARAMADLARDPKLRRRLGCEAQRTARRRHRGETWCRGVHEWLEESVRPLAEPPPLVL